MIIDVHAHYFPPEYGAQLRAAGLGVRPYSPGPGAIVQPPFVPPAEILEERLAAMDDAGVGRQILSIIAAPYHEDEAAAVALARLGNDLYAGLCRVHPDRFSFWASLPLPHAHAAASEARRAMDELGALGVTLQTFCRGQTIADPAFDPLFAELDRCEATVFIHPCQNALATPLIGDFGLTTCLGASVEDSVAALHLIVHRIPERYPRIRFIVPHFGGILPMLLERLDGQLPVADLTELPSATARRFYYDTVGWGSEAALLAAARAFGADRLLPGSDWPFLLHWESYRASFDHIRNSQLPASEIEAILHRNVPALLGARLPACPRGC